MKMTTAIIPQGEDHCGAVLDDNVEYGVQMVNTSDSIVLDNGLVQLILSNPAGDVTGVKYGGIDNLLEIHNKPSNRGYWKLNWKNPGEKSSIYEGL